MPPKSRPFSIEASTKTGEANVLTGESTAEDIHGSEFGSNGSDILVSRYIRPVLRQHRPTKRINFDLKFDLESGSLEPEIKTAYSRKETTERHCPGSGVDTEALLGLLISSPLSGWGLADIGILAVGQGQGGPCLLNGSPAVLFIRAAEIPITQTIRID